MTRKNVDETELVEVYNDLENYPTLRDVANQFGLSERTIRRTVAAYRKNGRKPDLIVRNNHGSQTSASVVVDSSLSSREQACERAELFGEELTDLVMSTQYPLQNPEAIRVESHVVRRYDHVLQDYVDEPGTPRTWLSDTLYVEPVTKPRNQTFIFTGAQNDADVHQPFWRNLLSYAAFCDAQVVVGPWTYETQWWSENNPTSRSYAPELRDRLCYGQFAIGENFVFCGEMNTLPTASRPISDLTTYSRGRWAVFPHAKIQLKSVPSTDPAVQAHQVMTTGSCTLPKVIPRKAGVKSIFHHVIGATIVEFDRDGDVFCRQINAADDGSFYDLDRFVDRGRVREGRRVRALICADIHTRKLDPWNAMSTFGVNVTAKKVSKVESIVERLRPEMMFLHDLHDHESRNHHHIGDNAYSYEMAIRNRESVLDEVKNAADFLTMIQRRGTRTIVVDSNHDLALERYVREGRYRNDGINVRFGLQLEDAYLDFCERMAAAKDAFEPVPSFSLLEHAIRRVRGEDVKDVQWVHDGQSFRVDEIECGHHGFRGANGSRGTVTGFARVGRKMSIADKHSPEIMDGVYVAGAMNLHHGYNRGPSSWAVTHIVHYPNGKRSLITLQKGKWRAV